ncbi:50S ribosomal protein L34e [Clarias magur]|uniref:50S ribosomal protein L34e n=1 Tax=Clarias magur TaxID=1594786 RepID=A0A8J4U4Z8_CLAMG|nr:50S ribosomal protein L34e [Clarias magur]
MPVKKRYTPQKAVLHCTTQRKHVFEPRAPPHDCRRKLARTKAERERAHGGIIDRCPAFLLLASIRAERGELRGESCPFDP